MFNVINMQPITPCSTFIAQEADVCETELPFQYYITMNCEKKTHKNISASSFCFY